MKYVLFLLAGIIGIYLILCLLGPRDMNVEKSVEITAPPSVVYNLSNQPKLTELWNSWTIGDTTLKTSYNEIIEGVGAESKWTSDQTGGGTSTIVESIKNSKVRTEMAFDGWGGENYSTLSMTENGGNTNTSWTFEGAPLPFFMRGFAMITGMKKSMHSNYTESLQNLKKIAEERANGLYNGMEVKLEDLGEKHFIMNRQKVQPANIQQFYATNLGNLFSKAQSSGIEMQGMPCGLYFSMLPDAEGALDMAAAIPISTGVSIEGTGFISIPERQAITLDYYGDYSTIPEGHIALEAYMKDRGYLLDYPVIEEYVTDPGEEPDPSKYLTRITRYFTPSNQ